MDCGACRAERHLKEAGVTDLSSPNLLGIIRYAKYQETINMSNKKPPTKISQNSDEPVSKEVLATAIVNISNSVQKLFSSGLNRSAVVALIKDDTGIGKGTIETVLDSLSNLRASYCKG